MLRKQLDWLILSYFDEHGDNQEAGVHQKITGLVVPAKHLLIKLQASFSVFHLMSCPESYFCRYKM